MAGFGIENLRGVLEANEGVVSVPLNDDLFFFYDPLDRGEKARTFPMATIITSNTYDTHSDLDREGVFRLNLGLDRATFTGLFPQALVPDYRAVDVIMPHPDYAQFWFVCVLNPDQSMPQVHELIGVAHTVAKKRYRT